MLEADVLSHGMSVVTIFTKWPYVNDEHIALLPWYHSPNLLHNAHEQLEVLERYRRVVPVLIKVCESLTLE